VLSPTDGGSSLTHHNSGITDDEIEQVRYNWLLLGPGAEEA